MLCTPDIDYKLELNFAATINCNGKHFILIIRDENINLAI